MNIIEKNIEEIRQLCLKYKVANLFVFGSVLTEDSRKAAILILLLTLKMLTFTITPTIILISNFHLKIFSKEK